MRALGILIDLIVCESVGANLSKILRDCYIFVLYKQVQRPHVEDDI